MQKVFVHGPELSNTLKMNLLGLARKEPFPKDEEGESWLEVHEEKEPPRPSISDVPRPQSAEVRTVHVGHQDGIVSSYADADRQREFIPSSFVTEPSGEPPYVWYRPACSAGWVIPVLYIMFLLVSVVIADISIDDYYADLIVALVISGVYFMMIAFYYIGRYLDTRYSNEYPACNIFWRYVCFPVGCLRVNATNIASSASSPPLPQYIKRSSE